MTPEQEIITDLLESVRALVLSARETLTLAEPTPRDADAFAAMPPLQRLATTAMIKQFEQLEGALHGLFRAMLRLLGVRLKGLYALDIANLMAELDVLDIPSRWVDMVKLRNDLVHDYPLHATDRWDRVVETRAAFPFLFDAAERAERVIRTRAMIPESP